MMYNKVLKESLTFLLNHQYSGYKKQIQILDPYQRSQRFFTNEKSLIRGV